MARRESFPREPQRRNFKHAASFHPGADNTELEDKVAAAKSVHSRVAGNESSFVAFPPDGLRRNRNARCHTSSLTGTHKCIINTHAHKRTYTKACAHRTHTHISTRTDACPNARGFACTYAHVRAHVNACPNICTYTYSHKSTTLSDTQTHAKTLTKIYTSTHARPD